MKHLRATTMNGPTSWRHKWIDGRRRIPVLSRRASVQEPPVAITPISSRPAPAQVAPVEHEGVRYEQDRHDDRDGDQPGGYLAATDIASGRRLWRLKVYLITAQPPGVPVFACYFRSMKLSADKAALDIVSEGCVVYRVDLGTRASTWVSGPPEAAPPKPPGLPKPTP